MRAVLLLWLAVAAAQTSTAPGPSSTSSPASTSSSSSTTPGNGAQCVLNPLPDPPAIQCPRDCCGQLAAGRRLVDLRISDPYDSFNCPRWSQNFLARFGAEPKVCGFRRGSSIVEFEVDETTATTLLTNPDSLGVPRLLSVTDPLTGQTTTTGGGALHIGAIIGIIIGVLALIAIVVLVVVLAMRGRDSGGGRGGGRSYNSRSDKYVPLMKEGFGTSSYPTTTTVSSSSTMSAAPLSSSELRCRITTSFDAPPGSDSSVLSVARGEQVLVLVDDFNDRGDWLWVRKMSNGREGYVPRAGVQRL